MSLPFVVSVHTSEGEDGGDDVIVFVTESNYKVIREVSDVMADMQLKHDFVCMTNVILKGEE